MRRESGRHLACSWRCVLFAGGRRRRVFAMLLAAAIPWTAIASDPAGLPPVRCDEKPAIPVNVVIGDAFMRSLFHDMTRRSATFRAQLLTIANTRLLLTRLRTTYWSSFGLALAQTTFGRSDGGILIADIDIPILRLQPRQNVEYIAHELEHVLEQIEGLDLPALARTRGSGVHAIDTETVRRFETRRAISVGQTVEREFFFSPDPCAGGLAYPAE